MKTDSTIRILSEIRDSVREINARLDRTNESLDQTREELSRRIVASEIRTATAITDLAHNVKEVATLLREQHDLRPRVEQCESEIAELKRRIPA